MAENSSRCRVLYSGQVQGVGFRYTAANIVRRFPLSGFVRNCRDGSVELLLQGEKGEIERALEEIRSYWQKSIAEEKVDWAPERYRDEEFHSFEVARTI